MTGTTSLLGALVARLSEAAGLGMFGPEWRVVTEQGDSEPLPFMLVQTLGASTSDGELFQIDCHARVTGAWSEMNILDERIITAAETTQGVELAAGVSEVHSRVRSIVFLRLVHAA